MVGAAVTREIENYTGKRMTWGQAFELMRAGVACRLNSGLLRGEYTFLEGYLHFWGYDGWQVYDDGIPIELFETDDWLPPNAGPNKMREQ